VADWLNRAWLFEMSADTRPASEELEISSIKINPRRRAVREKAVADLALSIEKIGLRMPITVRTTKDHKIVLVAGAHRIAAFKKLGRDKIDCYVLDENEPEEKARLWEIAENLHQAELTALEKSEHIAEWVKLTEMKMIDRTMKILLALIIALLAANVIVMSGTKLEWLVE
jgi:ParB/RepB/Spo0J family partition protein